jgi:two-component system LytT family response regulator
MIRAIIVEDEPGGRKLMQRLLEVHCPEVRVLEAVASAKEGRRAIALHNPDVVFLDVEMPGESGIDMLRGMGPVGFHVIFVTAHQDYAIEAIRLSALDYLLKPVRTAELVEAVKRIGGRRHSGIAADQVKALFHNLEAADPKIGVSTRKGVLFVRIRDIVRCDAVSNYTKIVVASGETYLASRTLKHFEELLGPHAFVRVHQSHLVNARYIRQYVRGDGGSLLLTDGTTVEVSRRYKDRLMGIIEKT